MRTSKMYGRIKWYKKEFIYNQYVNIVESFKDILIYDEVIMNLGIKMGNNFEKTVNSDLSSQFRYYHS